MKLKKICLSTITLSTILLTVGCNSNNNNIEQNIDKEVNAEISTEVVETTKAKYSDDLAVQAFFELATKSEELNVNEFIDAVKSMDLNNTFSIEKKEYDEFSAPNILDVYMYIIKSPYSNVTLRVDFAESEGLESFEDEHLKISDVMLLLPDENLKISYNTYSHKYTATLESLDPIVTKENLSQFKEVNHLDEKYLKLQDKLISDTNMVAEDIEELWNYKLTDSEDMHTGQMDKPFGTDENGCDIMLRDDSIKESEYNPHYGLNVYLKDSSQLAEAQIRHPEICYGYESKDMVSGSVLNINDSKFTVSLYVKDKASLITKIEQLYNLKSK